MRLTERAKLYDKYCTGSVNQHTVKLQFLNKIHRKNPPFRIKVRHPRTKTIKVRKTRDVVDDPHAPQEHYADPMSLQICNAMVPTFLRDNYEIV